MLQAYIYVIVIKHCGEFAEPGTVCLPREMAMMASLETLPKSILISTLATLKTWVELVFAARAAGLTVLAKGLQLWNVGAGLPLDALKKGTIVDWACPYKLDPSEIQPLLDALSKNGSTPLLVASREGSIPVVKALLDFHAHPDDGGDKGWPPLFLAAAEGCACEEARMEIAVPDLARPFRRASAARTKTCEAIN